MMLAAMGLFWLTDDSASVATRLVTWASWINLYYYLRIISGCKSRF